MAKYTSSALGSPDILPVEKLFDALSDYLIPKSSLCNQSVSVYHNGYLVIGYPVLIESSIYQRNNYLFNVCLVVGAGNAKNQFLGEDCHNLVIPPERYGRICAKLAKSLKRLEVSSQAVSNSKFEREPGSINLRRVLKRLVDDLNNMGECNLSLGSQDFTYLALEPNKIGFLNQAEYNAAYKFADFEVPVLMIEWDGGDEGMDLSLKRVISCIDGVTHVSAIVKLCGINRGLVFRCFAYLTKIGIARWIDIFQLRNSYVCCKTIWNFNDWETCRDFCVKKNSFSVQLNKIFSDLESNACFWFSIYSEFETGKMVQSLLESNPLHIHNDDLNKPNENPEAETISFAAVIDPRKLIAFGVLNGLLKRVHRYPFLIRPLLASNELREFVDGTHCMDELCVRLGYDLETMEKILGDSVSYLQK